MATGFVLPASMGMYSPMMGVQSAPIVKGADFSSFGRNDDLTCMAWASADRLLACLYFRAWRLRCKARSAAAAITKSPPPWESPVHGKVNLGQNARAPPSGVNLSPVSPLRASPTSPLRAPPRQLQPSSSLGSLSVDFNITQEQLPFTATSPSAPSRKATRTVTDSIGTFSLSPSPTSMKSNKFSTDIAFGTESTTASPFAYPRAQPMHWGSPVQLCATSPQHSQGTVSSDARHFYALQFSSLARPLGEHARCVKLWCIRSWQVAVTMGLRDKASSESSALRGQLCLLEAEHAKTLREAAGRQKAATELLEKHKGLAQNQAMCHADVVEAMRAREGRLQGQKERKSAEGILRIRWAMSSWQAHVISRRGRVRCTMLHATLNELQGNADSELILVLMFLHWALGARDGRLDRMSAEQDVLNERIHQMNTILMSQVQKFEVRSEQFEMHQQDSEGQIMRWRERAEKAESSIKSHQALLNAHNDRTVLMREKLGHIFVMWAYVAQLGVLSQRGERSVLSHFLGSSISPSGRSSFEPVAIHRKSTRRVDAEVQWEDPETHKEMATQFNEAQENECQTDWEDPPDDYELHYECWCGPIFNGTQKDVCTQVCELIEGSCQTESKVPKTPAPKRQVARVSFVGPDGEKLSPLSPLKSVTPEFEDDEDDEYEEEEDEASTASEREVLIQLKIALDQARATIHALSAEVGSQWDDAQERTQEACIFVLEKSEKLKLQLLYLSMFRNWRERVRTKKSMKKLQQLFHQEHTRVTWDRRTCFIFWVQFTRSCTIRVDIVRKAMSRLLSHMVSSWTADCCWFWFTLMKRRCFQRNVLVRKADKESDVQLFFLKWLGVCQCFEYERNLQAEEQDLCLPFQEAPWPPPHRFKFELRKAFGEAGGEGLADLDVRLREPSVIAVVRGIKEEVAKVEQSSALKGLEVLGYKLGLMGNPLSPQMTLTLPSSQRPSTSGEDTAIATLRGSLANLSPEAGSPNPRASMTGRLSRTSSAGSVTGTGEDEEKAERTIRLKLAERLGFDADVEKVSKGKYRIKGKEYTMMVKNDQVLVLQNASRVPLEKVFGASPDSQPGSRLSTPRSSAAPPKATSKAGAGRSASRTSVASNASSVRSVNPAKAKSPAAKSPGARPPTPNTAKAKPAGSRR